MVLQLPKSIYIASEGFENIISAVRIKEKMIEKFGRLRVFDLSDASRRTKNLAPDRRETVEKTVEKMVRSSAVLIAVIGKNWTSEELWIGQKGLGLRDPHNLNRIAIATALKGNTPVMPVLVNGASMPKADKLPNDLRPLTRLDAIEVRSSSWEEDMRRLINTAGGYVGQQEGPQLKLRQQEGPQLKLNALKLNAISESLRTKSEVSPSEAVREPKPTQPDPTQADTLRPETIFISYSRKDWDKFVEPLVIDLRQQGFEVWIDQTFILGGDNWYKVIQQALETCERMVLCVSPDSLESSFVQREYRSFMAKGKWLLPLICREAPLPWDLEGTQYVPYQNRAAWIATLRRRQS